MADTNFGINHPLAVKLWSKRLFREALKETYISRFMGEDTNSLVYVKDELSKSAGDRVRCGLRMQMSGTGIFGDDTLEGNEEELTFHNDDLLINQLRHAARSNGRASEQRVPYNVREECMDGLRDWWADRIDTAFFNHVCGNVAGATTNTHDGGNAVTSPTSAAGNTRILYGAGSTSTTASFTATSSNSGSIRQVNFQLGVLDKAVNQAKIASPLIRPIRVEGQYKYVAFLHPNAVRQLRMSVSTTAVTWFDIMRARAEGGDYKNNPIYNGAIGEYNGVILHESTRIPGLSTDTNVKFNVLCGAQAALFATGRENSDQKMTWVEELFDYENKLGVGAGMVWGLKKSVYNSIDFSTIVLMSHSPNPA